VPNSKDIAETDVFVLIDFPSNIIDDRVIQQIGDELAKGKSVLYIAGKHISKSKLKNIESYLPFSIVSDSRNEYAANVLFNDNALSNTVFASYDYDIKEIADDLPPVFKTESFYKAKPDATSFSTFQVNNTVIDEPTILSKTNGKSRSWAFLVYGLYRWQLADFSSKQETQNTFYSNMISNVFKWLSISDRMERFVVNTNRNVYQNSEMIEINAQLYDEKYEPVDNASIEVVIQNSKFQKELTLKSLTNGRYLVNVEGIPVGDYSVKAEASLNNKSKLNASTSFTVEQLQLENRNYGLNKSLLEKLAQNSGGRYLHITEADSLLSIIKTNYPGQDKQISTTNEINLWNSVYLLSLVMILLSVEWFLRKRFGMI
jgi:hypothetical protein